MIQGIQWSFAAMPDVNGVNLIMRKEELVHKVEYFLGCTGHVCWHDAVLVQVEL